MKPIACNDDLRVLISSYADGQVAQEEERRAIEHLAGCAECRARIEEWNELTELYQWAYTKNLPEVEIMAVPMETSPRQPAAGLAETLRRRLRPHRRWAVAGALASAVLAAGATALWMRPPLLTTSLRTGAKPQVVRLQGGIRLEVSPHSTVTRVGDGWVKLEAGSVRATVRHRERGFHLQSPRLDTYDLGTRFTVATGPMGDAVTVDEGSVTVHIASPSGVRTIDEGQALLAMEGRAPMVVRPPVPKPGEDDGGQPLYQPVEHFQPEDLDNLDWRDGVRRLSERYPDLRWTGSRSGGGTTANGLLYYANIAMAPGLRAALREHFHAIALGLSGAPMPGDPWEITAFYVHLTGVAEPVPLPADLYVVRLVSDDGRLVWRLAGSEGAKAELPVEMGAAQKPSFPGAGFGESIVNSENGSLHAITWSIWGKDSFEEKAHVFLSDWPGSEKPALRFTLRGMSLAERDAVAEQMAAKATRLLGLHPGTGSRSVVYLDPERRHRMAVVWDTEAAARMATEVRNRNRRANAGVIGAIVTEAPLADPDLPAGAYHIWWDYRVGRLPIVRMGIPGGSRVIDLPTAPAYGPARSTSAGYGGYGGSNIALPPHGGNGPSDTLRFESMGPAADVFRFRVRMMPARTPEDESPWGQGWFSVKQP